MPDRNTNLARTLANDFRPDEHNAAVIYAALRIEDAINAAAKRLLRRVRACSKSKPKERLPH
jgi:hypothetical protein